MEWPADEALHGHENPSSGWTYEEANLFETGLFPDPGYINQDEMDSNAQLRRRGVPWTEEEHQLFLMGLNKYGKGDWRNISRYYVITKTSTQVASHAQKYFRRQTSSTPLDKRRPSIHDIQTVNPTALASVPQPQINCDEFSSRGLINPMYRNNFNGMDQNSMFPPVNNSGFPSDQTYASSYLLPSLANQQWR